MGRLDKGLMWDWLAPIVRRAEQSGDPKRLEMLEVAMAAAKSAEGDFARGLVAIERGRALAMQVGEFWLALLFDYLHLLILSRSGRLSESLTMVQALLEEVKKPIYKGMPLRVCLHEELVHLKLNMDPLGNMDLVRESLAYMEATVLPESTCAVCVGMLRRDMNRELGNWDEVGESLRAALIEDADADSTLATDYLQLCRVAYEREDWQKLRSWARKSEPPAQRAARHDCLAESAAWQALLARRAGDEVHAKRHAARAMQESTLGERPMDRDFYDAMCLYHESAGELGQALQMRHRQITSLSGKGRFAQESRCRVQICTLLLQMGRPLEKDLAAGRETAASLIDPAPILRELDAIAAAAGAPEIGR